MSLKDIESGVVANSNSKIYHAPKCYCVPYILEEHKVDIDLAHYDEKGRSYRPCSKCLGEIKKIFNEDTTLDLFKDHQVLKTTNRREPLADLALLEDVL